MIRSFHHAAFVLLCFGLASALGCAKQTTARTELVIVVDSDLASDLEIDHISVSATRVASGAAMQSQNGPITVDGQRLMPKTLSLLHTGGDLGPILVVARALKGGSNGVVVLEQQARVSFVARQRRVLRMELLRSCLNVATCGPDQTCVAGACTVVDRDSERTKLLPDGGQLHVSDGGLPDLDAGMDAGPDAARDAGDAGDAGNTNDAGDAGDAGDGGDAGEADAAPTCVSQPEECNGLDDNCDGVVDDGFDFASVEHCGTCDNACPTDRVNARSFCDNGQCAIECAANTDDCSGGLADGCETVLTSPLNCGTCGNQCSGGTPFCAFDGIGLSCVGACGVLTQCVEGSGASCVDTTTDPLHCGGCDPCTAQSNATPSCVNSVCQYSCFDGYASCSDGNNDNGCETNIRTDALHCNACNTPCPARANAMPRCVNGGCSFACNNGFSDCNAASPGGAADGCEVQTNSDPNNCGSCGNVCPQRANSTPSCNAGVCGVTCNAGFGNCDGSLANGCETNTNMSIDHCGTCGDRCTGLGACCRNGACRSTLCL